MLIIKTKAHKELVTAHESGKYNVFVEEGGSRSGKTWGIIQFWLKWAKANEGKNKRVIVSRKKGTWLTATVLKDFVDVLKEYGIYNKKDHNKSTGSGLYRLFGNEFWFLGLDDEQRIHGMRSDAFWINEAIEANKNDYDQMMQRCSGFAILDYNPSEDEHWIYDSLLKREKTWYLHTTMLDNRLIPKNAKEQILSYEPTEENYRSGTVDKRKWEIYGLGKRAKIEGLVFDGFEIIPDIPDKVKKRFTGQDFGYTYDPTAIAEVGIYPGENELYINELCYQTRMLTGDIINTLKSVNNNRKVISESADPRLISEIYNAGFNIHAVEKFQGSVKAGIDKMKGMKIFITERSVNIIKEFKNYTYQQDKNGKWLNEPVDDWNHGIDAVRYVVLTELLGKNQRRQDASKFLPG
ncbi:MAG TPA: PBSX family phage terminase large subunit [Agriterribacter sp.]|uniref:PBSX family phage terminase large subunit n=1 Tax=Agriterribacter sp. TaxID=2821509 RepID=UPI002CE28A7F|nr:PBSX family phage terminase large subunit [Agriterribacter sp.]HRQ17717.1 PBSX family phage terminase large subunit [Agriterribacter sp.]